MATRGIGIITNIGWEGDGSFRADVSYVGFSEDTVDAGFALSVSKTVTELGMESDVKDAIKDKLINEHGFTWQLGDTVRLIGATV